MWLSIQPLQLYAQTLSSVSVNVPAIQRLQVTNTKSIPDITAKDMQTGYIDIPAAITLQVSSNSDWQLVVKANRENLYVTNDFKSISDFKWRTGKNAFQSLTMRPQNVITGRAGAFEQIIVIDFRLELNWKNTPPGEIEYAHEFYLEPQLF